MKMLQTETPVSRLLYNGSYIRLNQTHNRRNVYSYRKQTNREWDDDRCKDAATAWPWRLVLTVLQQSYLNLTSSELSDTRSELKQAESTRSEPRYL